MAESDLESNLYLDEMNKLNALMTDIKYCKDDFVKFKLFNELDLKYKEFSKKYENDFSNKHNYEALGIRFGKIHRKYFPKFEDDIFKETSKHSSKKKREKIPELINVELFI